MLHLLPYLLVPILLSALWLIPAIAGLRRASYLLCAGILIWWTFHWIAMPPYDPNPEANHCGLPIMSILIVRAVALIVLVPTSLLILFASNRLFERTFAKH